MIKKIKTSFQNKLHGPRVLYQRYNRFIPIVSFFAGFTWDNLTLTRIDEITDNMFLFAYIIALGFAIMLTVFDDRGLLEKSFLLKYRQWYPSVIQFLLGGLFSTYVVFYFQSASFTKTSLFLLILVALLVANEFLSSRLTNTYLLTVLYFLATSSFFIFFLPVLIGIMNDWIFLAGGIISLGFTSLLLYIFDRCEVFETRKIFRHHALLTASVFLGLNLFYQLNWIPPVPLSLKYAGIYHHASRQGDLYLLRFEEPKWYQFFKDSDSEFSYAADDTVFCFASVFAPTDLKKKILHHWQFYSENRSEWVTTDRAGYALTGGRDGGYRGYTYKKNVTAGEWRVDIKTEENLLLGRLDFEIIEAGIPPRKWRFLHK